MSILDASGNVLSKENVDDSETIVAKAESSGTYYVLVDNYGEAVTTMMRTTVLLLLFCKTFVRG